jgi:hypothetical protein
VGYHLKVLIFYPISGNLFNIISCSKTYFHVSCGEVVIAKVRNNLYAAEISHIYQISVIYNVDLMDSCIIVLSHP